MAEPAVLPDVQAAADGGTMAIGRAGVRGLRMPITYADADGSVQHTVARASAWAAVPAGQRGAHMSRLPAELERMRTRVAPAELGGFAAGLARAMDAPAAGIELAFPLFVERAAPVSGEIGLIDTDAQLACRHPGSGVRIRLAVPVTMLCPCSKEISERGAHSQRAALVLTATARGEPPSLLELIARIEQHASAPLYSVLKRADEKAVTEAAYDNPRFAEDAVRLLAADIQAFGGWSFWQVQAVNRESIHNHDVFACVRSADTAS